MLNQIHISNFALIENLTIDFYEGLNVLSGETGAGKSILIDAINYVLGSKFNKDLIRYGEDKTYVEAIFSIDNENKKEQVSEIIGDDDFLIISRETFLNGKSLNKVNGRSVTLNFLKEISSYLIDIHGQHDNQRLLDKKTHIDYLDAYGSGEHQEILNKYFFVYGEYRNAVKEKENLINEYGDKDKKIEYLKYRIDEINSLDIKIGEDEELSERINLLQNAEKIQRNLNESYKLLYESDEDSESIYDLLNTSINNLKGISDNLKDLKSDVGILEDFYYKLQDTAYKIRNYMDTINYDEDELNSKNSRLFKIENLKKKYGNEISEVLKYRDSLQNELDKVVSLSSYIDNLDKKILLFQNKLNEYGDIIHHNRENIGKDLENKIGYELKYIGMEKAKIKTCISYTDTYFSKGKDQVQFLISTNPGEPLKELSKIVSGGELSRIMLAIKTVFADKDEIPTLIFDEIDSGISGRTAQCVGEKLYNISRKHQVFCVTHLPQIAAFSDEHYKIEKFSTESKTYTKVEKLEEKEKILEIARMLGGKELTNLTVENAREMILNANKFKL